MRLGTFTPRAKYGNRKVTLGNGEVFDSLAEARRWGELLLLQRGGAIRHLQRQVRFELVPAQRDPEGRAVRAVSYVADFVYDARLMHQKEQWARVVEDVKGVRTAEYKLKAKLMLWRHGIVVREVS